ncbi:N-acetyltransferase [Phytoactinopolyspora alkaliphila]|uniref:N-acetyltransferase n=1 Tax=Phytoactinopolyspora alkaliphila TaxID=1783498 RepID=A0A6N9YGG4_9ACTN|nr:N-acetyltransferase [Phytoactinopolyspora alkaliphila]NED94017.1 N-acetyltransferase [Phytoactinopolyspora alkaliphila]
MPFANLEFDVPEGLTAEDFILRPIVAADAELDYAAVMESKDYLRTWEQSSWPEDDFTVAANREDLEKLEHRHANRQAFTYTMMNPAGTECLGCVYVMSSDSPMFAQARITAVANRRWDDYKAAVYFWVRKSRLETAMDRVLLDALRVWFGRDWNLGGHLIVTNEQFTQQVSMIQDTDLQLRFEIEEPGKPGRYLAYD